MDYSVYPDWPILGGRRIGQRGTISKKAAKQKKQVASMYILKSAEGYSVTFENTDQIRARILDEKIAITAFEIVEEMAERDKQEITRREAVRSLHIHRSDLFQLRQLLSQATTAPVNK